MFLDSRSQSPRVIAHRGARVDAAGQNLDENTLPSFSAAIAAGASILETDIQATKDRVAVIFHDDDLLRLCGLNRKVSQLTFSEIETLSLPNGGKIPTLKQVLEALPQAKFNIDFKSKGVLEPGIAAISLAKAQNRVLVASFSESRVRAAKKQLADCDRSASAIQTLLALLASKVHARKFAARLTRDITAFQVPLHFGRLRLDTREFIAFAHSLNLEVHFWVVNSPSEMIRLRELGADGIVTDDAAVATKTFM